MFSYMATSFLGFEAVCESEIKQKLKPHSTRILPQKVIFSSDILPSKIDHHNLKSGADWRKAIGNRIISPCHSFSNSLTIIC